VLNSLEMGGAERLVVAMATSQHRAGHAVFVQCLFGLGPLQYDLALAGIQVGASTGGSRTSRTRGVVDALRRFAPDVVHCHNVGPTLLAAPLARLFGARCVLSTRHGIDGGEGGRLREAKFWLAARACSHVVCVSNATARTLAREPFADASRLVTIFNGAPAPSLPDVSRRPEHPVLLCIARLKWPKDHVTLMHAIAEVRASVPRLQLWVVGDGPDRPALEQLCERLDLDDTVTFLGEQHDIGAWLARADLFVLSSFAEGAPLALLEALSAGLIPIATAAGGVPEIIERSGVGVLVPVGDHAALARSIARAFEERDRWPEWQQLARSAYERHFTMARMCEEYERLIVSSLKRDEH
jgi:glycosyltransferase involved in cell wall biosynthesis